MAIYVSRDEMVDGLGYDQMVAEDKSDHIIHATDYNNLTKTFNFAAREVIYMRNNETPIVVKNFSDIESWDELELVEAQLKKLGKNPKPLHQQPKTK